MYESAAWWPPGRADGSYSKGGKGGKKGKDGKDERQRYLVRAFVRWDGDKAVDIETGELGITIHHVKLYLAAEYDVLNPEDMVIWVPEIEHVGVLRQRAAADGERIAPGGQVIAQMPTLFIRRFLEA